MNSRVTEMSGKKFAFITVIRSVGKCSSGDLKWLFVCDCGNEFEANGYYARSGKITTCPSCSAERSRLASVKHGRSKSQEFEIWSGMQTRCYNSKAKAFKRYGGRGITICNRWKESFVNFLSDMGPRPSPIHSIERIDNDGNYEQGNCYWATREEQANNKGNNRHITINGVTKTIAQWSRDTGLSYNALWYRLQAGKTGVQIIEPLKMI